jgi:hypothetical protein
MSKDLKKKKGSESLDVLLRVWLLKIVLLNSAERVKRQAILRPYLSITYRLRKETARLADALLTVQTGDVLGFTLRSALKLALSSTPTFPGGSIARRQLTKAGPILDAAAVWGTIQGVLAGRQSQLRINDCRGVSMLHTNCSLADNFQLAVI